jgi:FrmR/RcnR family transcriptional regulator, repressor of frmRAB operon
MSHIHHDNGKTLARVRRIKGQMVSLERAIEEGSECGAVLQQLAAVKGAVTGLMLHVMEGHMRGHLTADAAGADPAELEVLISALRSYMK